MSSLCPSTPYRDEWSAQTCTALIRLRQRGKKWKTNTRVEKLGLGRSCTLMELHMLQRGNSMCLSCASEWRRQVNCKRLEEEAAADAGRGSCCPYFLCILSASACGPGDGFAVSMGLRHGGPWHSCAHISNSRLLRASSILRGVPKGSAGCSFPHFQAKPCGTPRAPTIWPRQGGGRTPLDRCFCLAFWQHLQASSGISRNYSWLWAILFS